MNKDSKDGFVTPRTAADFKPVQGGYGPEELNIPKNPDFPQHNSAKPVKRSAPQDDAEVLRYKY